MRGPKPDQTNRARSLRKVENDAASIMWQELRDRRLNGFKFVREYPLGRYFADFACRSEKLVVEIDGSQHANFHQDRERDMFMNGEGWSVLRFWHIDVLNDLQAVLETLVSVLEGRLNQMVITNEMIYLPSRTQTQ